MVSEFFVYTISIILDFLISSYFSIISSRFKRGCVTVYIIVTKNEKHFYEYGVELNPKDFDKLLGLIEKSE